jgi:hypothetical protein
MLANKTLKHAVDGGGGPEAFERSLVLSQSIVEFARARDFPEDECNSMWVMGICLRRLGRSNEAIRVLDELHERAWELRRKLRDPFQGIDFTSRFPHLFAVRCDLAASQNDAAALFGAIEASKGQIIADTLDATAIGEDVSIPGMRDLELALAATRQHQFHYLTYFADDSVVRAALVTSRGQVHVAEIPLKYAVIERYSRKVDPSKWGSKVSLWAATPSDLPDAMASLVSWLGPLFEQGKLRQDEHVVYCPDAALWLLPLQMLSFLGRPLLKTFSLSRTNSIRSLVNQLRRPPLRPTELSGFEVIARDEPSTKRRSFERAGDYLARRLTRGSREQGHRTTLQAWSAAKLKGSVVHLATHGIFPEAGMSDMDPNPLKSSGLLFADEHGLPLRSVHHKAVLTPSMVLSSRQSPSLEGSHVTLQACVSGWSRAGSGRDALGLEWAFGVRGASSVLSSNWHVDVDVAATFCLTFYREWLEAGQSRAAAARRAALEVEKSGAAYEWAAFTLAGDFR